MRRLISSLAVLGVITLGGCERYALDHQMEALCVKDGGVKVFETVTLPAAMFDQNGDPFPGWRQRSNEARLGEDYRLIEETTYLRQGDPMKGEGQLRRIHWKVIRKSESRVLGEATMYARSGGDFIVLGHFSSKTCPPHFASSRAVIQAVFIRGAN